MFFYDTHMHIIPNADDGSWSIDMSDRMLGMAYLQGVRKIIATPHSYAFESNLEQIYKSYQEVKALAENKYRGLQLYLGSEIRFSRSLIGRNLADLKAGLLPSMNGTKYVLTEFSNHVTWEEAEACADSIVKAGWIPILAHVERYKNLFEKRSGSGKIIEGLMEKGCLCQINVYSVYDEQSEEIKRNAREMIERKQVHFLGSDAHRTNHRPPSIFDGMKYLYANYEKEYIDEIAYKNSGRLLKLDSDKEDRR